LCRWHTAARIPVGRDRLPHQARTSRPDWRTYWTLQPRLRVRTRPRLRHAYDRRRRIMKKTRSHETSEGRGAGDQPDRQRERRLRKPSGDAGAQPTDPSILFACPFRHDTTLRAARLPSITAHVTPVALFAHRSSSGSPTARPFDSLSGSKGGRNPRQRAGPVQASEDAYFLCRWMIRAREWAGGWPSN